MLAALSPGPVRAYRIILRRTTTTVCGCGNGGANAVEGRLAVAPLTHPLRSPFCRSFLAESLPTAATSTISYL